MRRYGAGLGLAALVLAAGPAPASAPDPLLPNENTVVYQTIPDVKLTDSRGEVHGLAELWGERPLILTMVFSSCAEICPFYIRSLDQAVSSLGGAGERYDVVVVSFDPSDRPEDMARVAERHDLAQTPGWRFAVTTPEEASRLAAAIGFWFDGDPADRRFDHPAMLAAIDRGVLVRLLVGATVVERRLREVIWELDRVLVPAYPLPSETVLFRCFGYDPETGQTSLEWGLLLLLLPGIAMSAATAWIFKPEGVGCRADKMSGRA